MKTTAKGASVKVQVTALAFTGQLLAILLCGVDVVVILPAITINLLLRFQGRPGSAE
jgi:hypothetical protein